MASKAAGVNRLVISEPKTDRARRTVPLSPAVVAMLRKHRTAQKAERLRAANQWQDSGLVFTTELGGPGRPAQPAARHRGCRAGGRRSRVSGCTPCGTRRRWHGSNRACTSRPSPTCSGTAASRSPATYRAHQRRHGTRGSRRAGRTARTLSENCSLAAQFSSGRVRGHILSKSAYKLVTTRGKPVPAGNEKNAVVGGYSVYRFFDLITGHAFD